LSQVIALGGFYKVYFGFLEILIFWAFVASFWRKKIEEKCEKVVFEFLDPKNGRKSQNLKKSEVSFKMQQLDPVWGPEINYEVIYSHKRQNIATKIGIKLTSICQFQI
jgi:hypothetical protein